MSRKLSSVTTIHPVHTPGSQTFTQHLRAADGLDLQHDAIGVMVRVGDVFSIIPWGNIKEAPGVVVPDVQAQPRR